MNGQEFQLDPRLEKDCHLLGSFKLSQLLLMDNSLVPWFILVPMVEENEIHLLAEGLRNAIYAEVEMLARFIQQDYKTDKLNIATIGNVVNQLHIHVVGRYKSDYCWPGVVWGIEQKERYPDSQISNIKERLTEKLGSEIEVFI